MAISINIFQTKIESLNNQNPSINILKLIESIVTIMLLLICLISLTLHLINNLLILYNLDQTININQIKIQHFINSVNLQHNLNKNLKKFTRVQFQFSLTIYKVSNKRNGCTTVMKNTWIQISNYSKNTIYQIYFYKPRLLITSYKKNSPPLYSGQGAQSAIIGLRSLFGKSSQLGFKQIVIGSSHRGKLNILTNLLDYPPRLLFRKIRGNQSEIPQQVYNAIDDVVSHIGFSISKTFIGTGSNQKQIKVTLINNSSHLQSQNAISMGKTKCKQDQTGQKVLNLQIHGDAAFSAQGIVYETFSLSKVRNFSVNGSIHLIINNQLGFTTYPLDGRSSRYCTGICKGFDMPIIHVNGNDVQSMHKLMKMCVQYKDRFKKDIIVDLVCYRKYGHNQVDQPVFTQPYMYKTIRNQKSIPDLYWSKLIEQGLIKQEAKQNIIKKVNKFLQQQYAEIGQMKGKENLPLQGKWKGYNDYTQVETGINKNLVQQLIHASVFFPTHIHVHPRIIKFHIQQRIKQFTQNKLSWTTCQALAVLSLLKQGYNFRLSGQDVERGTFSQRHFKFICQQTQQQFSPITNYAQQVNQNSYICNSPLSQYGVLSFQYGYSIQSPNNLVIWQAQYGDFANGAQIIIDNYIANSQAKWRRQTGLVLNLPHGIDGAGPQHSSCRIQRFLQMSNSDGINSMYRLQTQKQQRHKLRSQDKIFYEDYQSCNLIVVNLTKASNYFHVLRRQMKRKFRKPLIIASPKTHKKAFSQIEQVQIGSQFRPFIYHNQDVKLDNNKNVIFCSDILKNKIPIISIQELVPFPENQIKKLIKNVNKEATFYWVQQESMNCGAYNYAKNHLQRIMNQLKVSRKSIAATATGNIKDHKLQSQSIIKNLKQLL